MENLVSTELPSVAQVEDIFSEPDIPIEERLFKDEKDLEIARRLLPHLAGKANALAEAKKAKEMEAALDSFKEEYKTVVANKLKEIEEQNKPPTPEDLEKLLTQEYKTFTVKFDTRDGGQYKQREFTIREMPQAIEMKFVSTLQKALLPRLKELNSVEFSGGAVAQQVEFFLGAIPELIDMLAEECALVLDPYGSEGITKAWVQGQLSSNRIKNIVLAQVEVNRIRDFLSGFSHILK